METKGQILFIHGGMTFKNRANYLSFLRESEISLEKPDRWHEKYLKTQLGKEFDIIKPKMPMADNANYEDWKIHFEKYIPFLKDDIVLIGQSLGGIFLARYLSENVLPVRILALFLIAAPFDNSLPGEDLVGGFKLKADLSLLDKKCKYIIMFYSQDDEVVPVSQGEKYKKKLPRANVVILDSANGHFKVSKFPQLVKIIKCIK